MAKWEKVLRAMLADTNPVNYTYEEAASILERLDFVVAPKSGSSHRKWRRAVSGGNVAYVGLVNKGSGTLAAWQVRDMIAELRKHRLLPKGME